jgi:hypothetical protein
MLMSDIREKPEQIDIPTDPIGGPAEVLPHKKEKDEGEPVSRTTDEPYENEG